MSNPITPEELKWYAIDFDNTLAMNTGEPDFAIGKPIHQNLNKLKEVHEAGYKIIIHTARHWEDYRAIEEWLDKHQVPYKAIVCGKILAHRYVDDKNINAFERSWL